MPIGRNTRVLIADDHKVVRAGIRTLLQSDGGIEVVSEACDGLEAVRLAEELRPNVVVMDITMPLLNGIDATAQVVRNNASIAVIMLSMYSDEVYVLRALSAGARGYLLKDSADDDLITAIRTVAGGRPFFSPAVTRLLMEEYVQRLRQQGLTDSYDLLTEREKQILQLLAEGKSNRDVAAILEVSPYTVETHRNHLMQKLDLHSTAEIVLYAVRKRIIQ